MADPHSVFHYFRQLIALRKQYEVIPYGAYRLILENDPQIFAYTRTLNNEQLLVVCNYSNEAAAFTLPEAFEGAECLITNLQRTAISGDMTLRPYECFVLYRR